MKSAVYTLLGLLAVHQVNAAASPATEATDQPTKVEAPHPDPVSTLTPKDPPTTLYEKDTKNDTDHTHHHEKLIYDDCGVYHGYRYEKDEPGQKVEMVSFSSVQQWPKMPLDEIEGYLMGHLKDGEVKDHIIGRLEAKKTVKTEESASVAAPESVASNAAPESAASDSSAVPESDSSTVPASDSSSAAEQGQDESSSAEQAAE